MNYKETRLKEIKDAFLYRYIENGKTINVYRSAIASGYDGGTSFNNVKVYVPGRNAKYPEGSY